MTYHLAIDIGASSGRHILGHLDNGKIVLEEIYRFDNIQLLKDGYDCWDTEMLFKSILEGIKKCSEIGKIPSTLAIDTWGVDYVLIDKDGKAICDAVAYRDKRTVGMKEKLDAVMPFEELYSKTGIQYQPYNTVYQLLAHRLARPDDFEKAERFLMMPEYFNYLLTGVMMNEYTNASTTAMLNAEDKDWDKDVLDAIGVPKRLFSSPMMPKTTVGNFTDAVKAEVGFDCRVILCASHDTGSAFMAVPAKDDTSVYISSGTWSLLGVENTKPLTGKDSMEANFTNEGGYEYRYRYLKNIMGLWMIQSIRRELNGVSYVKGKGSESKEKNNYGFAELSDMARKCEDFTSAVDVDKEIFLAPDSMIEAVKTECKNTNQPVPETIGEIMQCVYTSLSNKYAKSVKELEALTGIKYTAINIVGGGSQDKYLNERTAKSTGLKIYAGPIEGTAIGNLMAQFIAEGELASLSEARDAIHKSFDIIGI